MKQFKSSLLLLIGVFALTAFTSCEKEETPNNIPPEWKEYDISTTTFLSIDEYLGSEWDTFIWEGKWKATGNTITIPNTIDEEKIVICTYNNPYGEDILIASSIPFSLSHTGQFYPVNKDIIIIKRYDPNGILYVKWVRRK